MEREDEVVMGKWAKAFVPLIAPTAENKDFGGGQQKGYGGSARDYPLVLLFTFQGGIHV